jgi:hypothetical protein
MGSYYPSGKPDSRSFRRQPGHYRHFSRIQLSRGRQHLSSPAKLAALSFLEFCGDLS